ncbi:hypothetical protein [Lentzea nigeriaca]|uniref:hypothetical protein n=1 Tax=Lentzea nigeriaca TaxID=1128665 RepID=UPI00195DBE9B|nr:hypothetical protein [Lentzea nigeriaca]MBM7864608.1 hypothetical protein [Lentzea nigeriaca]
MPAGVLAAAALVAFYALVVGFAGGLEHLGRQTAEDWPWLVLIVGGFGTQIGLFVELRRRKRLHADVRAAAGGGAGASAAGCARHITDLAPVIGASGAVLIAFLVPFLDIGIAQSPMLRAEPPDWARFLPGYGADRVLLDGGLTTSFDETGALLLGLGWLLGLGVLAAGLFRNATA